MTATKHACPRAFRAFADRLTAEDFAAMIANKTPIGAFLEVLAFGYAEGYRAGFEEGATERDAAATEDRR